MAGHKVLLDDAAKLICLVVHSQLMGFTHALKKDAAGYLVFGINPVDFCQDLQGES
jgi:hypothetical protein